MTSTRAEREQAWDELEHNLAAVVRQFNEGFSDAAALRDTVGAALALARDLRKACEGREAELVRACEDAEHELLRLSDMVCAEDERSALATVDDIRAAAKGALHDR